jgi:hypothetical protein
MKTNDRHSREESFMRKRKRTATPAYHAAISLGPAEPLVDKLVYNEVHDEFVICALLFGEELPLCKLRTK